MLTIRFTAAIPAAVAGEIARLRRGQANQIREARRAGRRTRRALLLADYKTPGEGGAYKSALDRAGSDAMRCCYDFERDCDQMARGMAHGRRFWIVMTDVQLVADRARESLSLFRHARRA